MGYHVDATGPTPGATMSNWTDPFDAGREPTLSKGEIFGVLQNRRRRYVLQYLKRFGGPVGLGELATQVAAWEYRTPTEEVGADQRKRVYTTLQQTHLGKMADAGIIEYDDDEGVVDATPYAEDLTVYLEIVPGGEFPWREYYLSIGAISLAVVAALWAGLYPVTLLSGLQWAAAVAVTVTVSAAYHTYRGADTRLGDEEFPSGPPE